MAGTTTAERGERQQESSGPPPARRLRLPGPRTLVVTALALALLASGAFWTLYGSPWLRVERVEIVGTGVLTPEQVRDAARVPVGSPLVTVDTDAIEDRVRGRLRRVDGVEVSRSWPHTVEIALVERTPVLYVEQGGRFVEVDDDGVRYATVPRAPKGVPALELAPSRAASAAPSLRRFGEDRLVREAVRVARDLPPAVREAVRTVTVRSYDAVSLELTGNRTVVWGSSEKGAAKARALTALMKATPGARHFDVSVPTAPASSGS